MGSGPNFLRTAGPQSWTCRGQQISLGGKACIMGILNVTPDSFSDGGKYLSHEAAVEQGLRMISQGADIIDVGGESTRPGAIKVPPEEEIERVIPVVEALAKKTGKPISVDTYKSQVAQKALEAGASIINDISGLRFDPQMAGVALKYQAGLVLMHIKGTPEDMQNGPSYSNLLEEVRSYLDSSIKMALDIGIDRSAIAIDPGIGFGKTVKHNLTLIKNLAFFRELGCPIVIGASRKSFIGKVYHDIAVSERLSGSLAAAILAVQNGADIVRCHDVAETKQALETARCIETADNG